MISLSVFFNLDIGKPYAFVNSLSSPEEAFSHSSFSASAHFLINLVCIGFIPNFLRSSNGDGFDLKSEIINSFDFERGSVGLARQKKYNTEDSQFFIILRDEPLYESEYTPIGKVIYGIKALEKIKYLNKSEYVLRPDYINSIRMLID